MRVARVLASKIVVWLCFALPALGDEFAPAMRDYLDRNIRPWAENSEIVNILIARNDLHRNLTQADIRLMDRIWSENRDSPDHPQIAEVLNNPAAAFLQAQADKSDGRITEAFIMDNKGLNAASSAVTSDMWQGDEAKFLKTFHEGPGAYHISDVEFDASTQRYQAQISITITKPRTGRRIGALTVGIDVERLLHETLGLPSRKVN